MRKKAYVIQHLDEISKVHAFFNATFGSMRSEAQRAYREEIAAQFGLAGQLEITGTE